MQVSNPTWTTKDPWPPTDQSPYDQPTMQRMKPGNFFLLAKEDHPAYDLFRALVGLGWQWNADGGRHWCHMWKDCYHDGNGYGERRWRAVVNFSLWGQGMFENTNEHGSWGIGFEDYDLKTGETVWLPALPHLTKFMQYQADSGAKMREAVIAAQSAPPDAMAAEADAAYDGRSGG